MFLAVPPPSDAKNRLVPLWLPLSPPTYPMLILPSKLKAPAACDACWIPQPPTEWFEQEREKSAVREAPRRDPARRRTGGTRARRWRPQSPGPTVNPWPPGVPSHAGASARAHQGRRRARATGCVRNCCSRRHCTTTTHKTRLPRRSEEGDARGAGRLTGVEAPRFERPRRGLC
jgi:hypothetical protein